MLRGEGMLRRKTVINNNRSNQQKQLFTCSTLSLYISLPFFLHNYNVKLPETSSLHVLWRKCRTCTRSLFFTAARFHLVLVAASICHFVTAATKFSCCSSNKNMSPLFFISIYRPFSRLSFAGLPPTFLFLCLSLALYSKFVDMTIYLSLKLQTTRIQNQFPLSVFVFIDCFVVSAFTRRRWLCDFPPKYPRVAFGLPYLLIELFYIAMPVVRTDGLSVYGHVITKFSRMGTLLHFLTHGAPLARFARESSAKKGALQ